MNGPAVARPLAVVDHPSPNHERRRGTDAPDMVILHYTGMADGAAALSWLCNPRSGVSAHYLVLLDGTVVRMVDEARRAWHAGVSHWRGARDINSRSIGIEIDNGGHDNGLPPYPPVQVEAVVRLLDGIRTRWTIPDRSILAHSDVAPERKLDPGERFPWAGLAARGHGLWTDATAEGPPPPVDAVQRRLAAFGYDLAPTGVLDGHTRTATAAFQRHFAPHRLDGTPDAATHARLEALLALAGE